MKGSFQHYFAIKRELNLSNALKHFFFMACFPFIHIYIFILTDRKPIALNICFSLISPLQFVWFLTLYSNILLIFWLGNIRYILLKYLMENKHGLCIVDMQIFSNWVKLYVCLACDWSPFVVFYYYYFKFLSWFDFNFFSQKNIYIYYIFSLS